jgi:hypothetical protein
MGHDEMVVGGGEVMEHFAGFGVIDDGADGDREIDAMAVATLAIAAFAVAAALARVFGVVAEVEQGVVVCGGVERDVAAASAIAAAGAAFGDVLFAAEGEAAVAAVAGFDFNEYFVYEHFIYRAKRT